MALFSTDYWIEFTNASQAGLVEWVHIAKAKFHIYRLKFPSLSTASSTMETPSIHQYITIISVLAVVIVVLLLLLAVGGVLFLVCVLRLKASRREGNHQEIAMKTNRAYCQVTGGGGGRTLYSNGKVKEGTEIEDLRHCRGEGCGHASVKGRLVGADAWCEDMWQN